MKTNNSDYVEATVNIDDAVIDKGDPYEIIDPVWWTGNIYDSYADYENSLKAFSREQRQIFAIIWYISEVNNGGHDQFFFNSTGIVWRDALEGLNMIGAVENATILQEAANVLGGRPSLDREKRWEQMGDDTDDKFDALDNRFYNISPNLDEMILKFIQNNREKFYFKGAIKKPKGTP